jgi:hypothetical protein
MASSPAPDLASVISTAELSGRPSRPPDYAAENRALVALTQEMTASSEGILQKRILVIEDEFFFADDITLSLARLGVRTIGPDATALWHQITFQSFSWPSSLAVYPRTLQTAPTLRLKPRLTPMRFHSFLKLI